jgi:outer membrane protein assembly factor BamB
MPLSRAALALVFGSHKSVEPADPAQTGAAWRLGRGRTRRLLIGTVGALAAAGAGFVAAPRPGGPTSQPPAAPAPQVVSSWSLGAYSADLMVSYAAVGGDMLYVYGENDSGDVVTYKLFALQIASGRIRWSAPLDGHSASDGIAVGNGRLYVGGNTEVYAFSAATGRLIWTSSIVTGVNSGPITVGNYVYLTDQSGDVFALNAQTGTVHWDRGLGAAVTLGDPTLASGTVYVSSGDESQGILYAINAADGALRWSVTEHSSTNPVAAGRAIYIGGDDLQALSDVNGHALWSTPNVDAGSDPVIRGGTVFIGTDNGSVEAIEAATGKVARTYSLPSADFDSMTSVSYDSETLDAEGDDGSEYGFRLSDGQPEWTYTSGSDDYARGPVPVVDGTTYVANNNSVVGLRAPG